MYVLPESVPQEPEFMWGADDGRLYRTESIFAFPESDDPYFDRGFMPLVVEVGERPLMLLGYDYQLIDVMEATVHND